MVTKQLTILILIGSFILAGCSNELTGGTTASVESEVNDNLAKCITESGAKMYGAFWCGHCKSQKAMFGDSWKFINYIECSSPDGRGQTNVCANAGITGYPTWEFADGTRKSGAIPLEELKRISNC